MPKRVWRVSPFWYMPMMVMIAIIYWVLMPGVVLSASYSSNLERWEPSSSSFTRRSWGTEKISSLPEVSHLVLVGTWSFLKIILFIFYSGCAGSLLLLGLVSIVASGATLAAVWELLIAVASLVAGQSSRAFALHSWGTQAHWLWFLDSRAQAH